MELPAGALVRGSGSGVLGRLCRERRWPTRAAAVLAIPSGTVRLFSFPDVPAREVRQAIIWELQRVLPYAVEDATIDLIPVPRSGPGQDGAWLAAACRADELGERVRHLRLQGLNPVAVEVQPLPLWRLALLRHPSAPDAAVLDLGANGSRLLIIANGSPDLFRDVAIGGADFTRAIAAGAGVPEAEAERLKRTRFQEELPLEWLETPLRELLTEIDRSLRFVRQQGGTLPERVLACGGGAGWPALLGLLAENLGLPVEPWHVPVEVTAAPADDTPSPDTAFVSAVAMASWDRAPVLRGGSLGDGTH